jgi:MoaA/NifB/PqqE/SkfB family radical SAM enzyme
MAGRRRRGARADDSFELGTAGAGMPVLDTLHRSPSDLPEIRFHLDNPCVVHGAATEPAIGRLTIEGWAISRSGIAAIDVQVDDLPLGSAQYGFERPDVGDAFPDWEHAQHSCYEFHVPKAALQQGQRLIKLTVRARNGQELVEQSRILVVVSEVADDFLEIYRPNNTSASKLDEILPTLLPTIIDQVYRNALCRPADADALSQYGRLLLSSGIGLRGFVDDVYQSQEFLTIVQPATEKIREAYTLLFERQPTRSEIYNHVQAFRETCRDDGEAIALLGPGGGANARFGIRPIKIEMDITNQCNIRCVMCPFSDPAVGGRKRRDLDAATFQRWANEMFSWAAQVGLMFGTEPTLNRNLLTFVKIAKAHRVPNVYFSTNGMKLTPELTACLIGAGLDEINVSLDAGTKDTFQRIRRGAKWDVVIANLRSLRDQKALQSLQKPRLHMSFVMMRSNIQELPQFVELAAELGAVVIYCTHLVAYDVLGTSPESLGSDMHDYAQYIDRAGALARQHGIHLVLPRTRQTRIDVIPPDAPSQGRRPSHLADMDQVREAHGLARRFARDEAGSCCPFPWHFIAIEPDGSVSPCGWWHAGPPMGNVHTQSFQEIWRASQCAISAANWSAATLVPTAADVPRPV